MAARLSQQGVDLFEYKKAACLPLSPRVAMGAVPPSAWHDYPFCRRQLSWYAVSPRAGQYLLVSAHPLEQVDLKPQVVIEKTSFKPPRLPGPDELDRLIQRESYVQARPRAWEDLSSQDPADQERWLKIMGLRSVTYQELFQWHRANHANFIEPLYALDTPQGPIPYSIGKTSHVCSACLEMYNVIGTQWPSKLVVPCPGGVLFAGLAVNRYYEVKQP